MRRFFDTNVLVCSCDSSDSRKMEVAETLIRESIAAEGFVVSTQVLAEFHVTATRRRLFGPAEALRLVRFWSEHDTVALTPELLIRGLELHQAHSLPMWDAMIVQAAIDARCDVLLTEDLQHGRRFGDLEISNPFLSAAHEPVRRTYRGRAKKGVRV